MQAANGDVIQHAPPGKRLPVEAEVLNKLRKVIALGVEQKVIQRIPHLALLSDLFYHSQLRPVMAEWLLVWMRRNGLQDIDDTTALRCLRLGVKDAAVHAALTDRQVETLVY